MRGRSDSATYTIERDGKSLAPRRHESDPDEPANTRAYPVAELAKVLPNSTFGYINMGDLNPVQVDSAFAIVKNTDRTRDGRAQLPARHHVRGAVQPDSRPFAKFTAVDSTYPGQVVWLPPLPPASRVAARTRIGDALRSSSMNAHRATRSSA